MHGNLGILLLLALCFPIVLLTRRLGGSSLIAYIIVGAIAGNTALVEYDHDNVHLLAEMGAALLLFSLGLEIDLPAMRKYLRRVIVGAIGQIGLTIAAGAGMMLLLGETWQTSIIIGCCLALSSTLMVLRALDEQHLRNKEEGQTVLGLLLAQDFALAPLLLLISFLVPAQDGHQVSTWIVAVGIVGLLLMTFFLRRFLASHLIARVRGAQVPELEVALSVVIALGAAYFTENLGIGAAVGAFCAGLALGGDEHRHAIETSTRPLQGLMAIIFFVSIGMQFNLDFVLNEYVLVIGALVISVFFKAFIAGFALRLTGMSARSAIGAGIMVGQVGEFSFVMVNVAFDNIVTQNQDILDLIIAVACLSLAMTPLLINIATRFLPKSNIDQITEKSETIVVGGLGPVGNTIVRALHDSGQSMLLVDRNEKLLAPWQNNERITCHLGKIEEMEEWLPVIGAKPKIVVLTFPIVDASALVAERLLKMDPDLVIIARSPFESQIDILYNAGVRYVICDERESARALRPLLDEILGNPTHHTRFRTSAFRKEPSGEFIPDDSYRSITEEFEMREKKDSDDDPST